MLTQGFIGLDIAKDSFTVAFLVVDALSGQIRQDHVQTFTYDRPGWDAFLQVWSRFQADHWWLGLEASGPYSALLETHLTRLGRQDMSRYRLSPFQVRDFAKSRSRRRTKTDRIDAPPTAIGRRPSAVGLRQQFTVHALPTPVQDADALRTLAHLDQALAQELVRIQNQVRQHLHFLFPELERRQARFSKALRSILAAFPSAQAIAQASLDDLRQAVPPRTALSDQQLEDLQALARTSFGLHDPVRAQTLQFLLERWAWLETLRQRVLQALIQAVVQRYPQAWRILTQIPGIGPRLAALFLALVGDLDRFPSPKAITAFGRPGRHPLPVGPFRRATAPLQTRRPLAAPRLLPHGRRIEALHPSFCPSVRPLPGTGPRCPGNPGDFEPQSPAYAVPSLAPWPPFPG